MQVVYVCGGTGTRLSGRRPGLPKSMVEVAGEPILLRLTRTLAGHPAIFVAAAGDPHVPAFVAERFPGSPLVLQPEPDGVASAIHLALPFLDGPALVALGDILLEGQLGPLPPAPALTVWPAAPERATRANFGVRLDGGVVTSVVEKPGDAAGLLCGLGLYLLTPEVIAAFPRTPRDARGELAITSAIAHTLDAGYRALEFSGRYFNVNTNDDLAEAEAALAS